MSRMIIKDIPFVSNTPDDSHCLQAAYMSIANFFDPKFDIPMDEWSNITGYEEGLGTWCNAGLVWFKDHGYEVKHIENFNFNEFINDPRGYMIAIHGPEAGQWGIDHTNVPAEKERMKHLISANISEMREPTLGDIQAGLNDGYLLRATVNVRRLNHTDGYAGHAVVIIGYSDKNIYLHDPGLPALPNREVTIDDFMSAWSDQERELDLIRLV